MRTPSNRVLLFATLLCAACTVALADQSQGQITVYKWVDAHGVIHYSDQPHPDAKKLHVTGAQTYSAPPPAQTSMPSQPAAAPVQQYRSCTITQPGDQQMLSNVHTATAVVQTDPPLRGNNQIHLFFDGQQLSGNGPSFTFPVDRGQHTVSAVVVDGVGQIVCETSTVTFYVHQASILNPNSPLFHRPRTH